MGTVTCQACNGEHPIDTEFCPVYGDPVGRRTPRQPEPHTPARDAGAGDAREAAGDDGWTDPFASRVTVVLPSGREFELVEGDQLLVGRDPSSPLAPELPDNVSRRHAQLSFGVDGIIVEDLGSTNGTYVDDRRIASPVTIPVATGGRITLGREGFHLTFRAAP